MTLKEPKEEAEKEIYKLKFVGIYIKSRSDSFFKIWSKRSLVDQITDYGHRAQSVNNKYCMDWYRKL